MQMTAALQALDIPVASENTARLFAVFDQDNSGRLEFEEFKKVYQETKVHVGARYSILLGIVISFAFD